ncbi:MAG: hypothetical protein TREMPRED_003959 [Tremellales sp. Tagirdzhanova-0007]|nr:MAG: hypothetical protein TREMPRED_003959 [Tremellales sp. Tagirdzhanova-0007]
MSTDGPNGHDQDSLQSPGAGPSRRSEDEDRELFLRRRKDYIELDQSVESSTELLTSLASYLSTFQHDLSAVSGQISDLQQRSADIEGQLRGRRTILPPLNALLSDITLAPPFVLTIRDTQPAQNPDVWLDAIAQLEEKITAVTSRSKVRAAHEMQGAIEGLRIKALTQLPPFLLSLIKPLRSASTGLSTNLAVLQTSLLLKYQPFYAFLYRQSPRLAKRVERGYVNAARAYYETGMRRYARALGQIKSRTVEKSDLIGIVSSEAAQAVLSKTPTGVKQAYERLRYAEMDMEGEVGVVLAYMADDKDYQAAPREAPRTREGTPTDAMSEVGGSRVAENDPMKEAERLWHEVLDPALDYCSAFFTSAINPPPPAVPLLTLIRLNDHLIMTADSRGALPLIAYLQGWKLAMWPVYRKEMDAHVESLRVLADQAEGKGFIGLVKGVKDGAIGRLCLF